MKNLMSYVTSYSNILKIYHAAREGKNFCVGARHGVGPGTLTKVPRHLKHSKRDKSGWVLFAGGEAVLFSWAGTHMQGLLHVDSKQVSSGM